MAAFFQLLRNRIFGRAFIILQGQPDESNSQEEKSSNETLSNVNNDEEIDENFAETSARNEVCNSAPQSNPLEAGGCPQSSAKEALCNSNKNSETIKYHAALKASKSKTPEKHLMSLYADLKHGNSLEKRCNSVLNLAVCLVHDSPDVEFSDLLEALNSLDDSHNFPDLAVCHALLLFAVTKMSMSLQELEMLEDGIMCLTSSLKRKDIVNKPKMYKTGVLVKDHNEIALKLCRELFRESYLDLWEIDVSTICCSTLCNLSTLVKEHDDELGAKYCFKNSTLKYILGMTGRSTQEVVSEFMLSSQKNSFPSITSHRVNQCLHVLEHALSVNPDLTSCESLQHESFQLPHCLTRLLGWSVSSVFPDETVAFDSCNYKFHLSTLVCILKVLSVLTFNPHQYDSFSNVKGLMEKVLICTLKAYFESENNHFDIQILCLEMLINLYIKHQKTFILLCLKRFKISESEEVLAVEALIKMLSDNLEKIKEVKESTPYPQNNNQNNANVSCNGSSNESDNDMAYDKSSKKPRKEEMPDEGAHKTHSIIIKDASNSQNSTKEDSSKKLHKENTVESDPVLLAASKDMEHSTVVSFICVLIVFFMRTKQSFEEFILTKLTSQALKEATDVCRKFLEFASLTGGMPVTGILILTQTINKLQAMQRD